MSASIDTSGRTRRFVLDRPLLVRGPLEQLAGAAAAGRAGCSDVSFQTICAAIVLAGVSAKLVPPTPVTHGDDAG